MDKNIDFLPRRIRQQRARRRRLWCQASLVGLCALGLGVLGYVRQGRVQKARADLDVLSSRNANVKRQLVTLRSLHGQMRGLIIKKRIDEQLGSHVDALHIMGELQRVLPESMTLTELKLETVPAFASAGSRASAYASPRAGPAPRPKKGRRTDMRVQLLITGFTPTDVDVANFIGQLAASELFEDVTMGYARNVKFRDRSARQFQATCYVVR